MYASRISVKTPSQNISGILRANSRIWLLFLLCFPFKTLGTFWFTGLTGNILVGEWQIALLVHFRRVMECSCKSTLKICRLQFYLISFTNSKLFLPFTVERKVFELIVQNIDSSELKISNKL